MLNPNRFQNFANTLALVLQHPETPADEAAIFRRDLLPIAAKLAGATEENILAPRPDVAQLDSVSLFRSFGLAVADVLEDVELPAADWNEIGDTTNEVENLLRPKNNAVAEAARIRGIVKEWARVTTQSLSPKQPDIETILRQFTKATCQLLDHTDAPQVLCDAIGDALRDVGNGIGAFDQTPGAEARRVITHMFKQTINPKG